MVESTFELPVINLTLFLNDPTSEEAIAECQRAAAAMAKYSACSVSDERVSFQDNSEFLNLLEDYFDQPTSIKMLDVRPELAYQVGATPDHTELPRCGRDLKCLEFVNSLKENDKPHSYDQKDPKWRFVIVLIMLVLENWRGATRDAI
jgi:hypothetical protein